MFVDTTRLKLLAGKGGNGVVAWRREKYLPKGGPYGGNGGRGGDVTIEADTQVYSLEAYRNTRQLSAQNGQPGGANRRAGKTGKSLTLKVPLGTLVKNRETGEILHDFGDLPSKWKILEGGRGGLGNACFKSSRNRAPNICTPGKPGGEIDIELELKLIADVGFVGMPNAGKSTLMNHITHTEVKIGAYPFTTLHPNLSYVEFEDYTRMLVADIPGIIKGAHENRGLGHAFLRHIERTSVLLFVIDISGEEGRDPFEDFQTLREEIGAYSEEMLERPFLVALNKIDKEGAKEQLEAFTKAYPFDKNTLIPISAQEKNNLPRLLQKLQKLVK